MPREMRDRPLTRTARAAVLPAPGQPVEIREFPIPRLAPGEVLLETLASEVCGTDVHLRDGRLAGVPYPIIPGHVSIGRVAEANEVSRDAIGNPLSAGSVVSFFDVHATCHSCYQCLVARQPNRCPSRRVYGITYSSEEGLLGGWGDHILLLPGVQTVVLPGELSVEDLIGGGCGLFTGFAAVDRAGIQLGDSVVVQGVGPVGLAAIAFARTSGAGTIMAAGEPAARRDLALRMGADEALALVGMDAGGRAERVRAATGGRGADVVIEASGNPHAVPEGFAMLRDGGRYVIVGHYTDAGTIPVNPHVDINRKHADVRGQWGSEFHHWTRALDTLVRYRQRIPFAEVIGRRYRLEEANQALDDVEALRVTKAIIVP
jgi:L-iditol 2-dehydrogenase